MSQPKTLLEILREFSTELNFTQREELIKFLEETNENLSGFEKLNLESIKGYDRFGVHVKDIKVTTLNSLGKDPQNHGFVLVRAEDDGDGGYVPVEIPFDAQAMITLKVQHRLNESNRNVLTMGYYLGTYEDEVYMRRVNASAHTNLTDDEPVTSVLSDERELEMPKEGQIQRAIVKVLLKELEVLHQVSLVGQSVVTSQPFVTAPKPAARAVPAPANL